MSAESPVVCYELDIPRCPYTFGVGPCTATLSEDTPRKCHNTRGTCSATAAYEAAEDADLLEILTIKMISANTAPPSRGSFFPCVTRATALSNSVNVAGTDPSLSIFGRRGTSSFTVRDFIYDDLLTDPYLEERKTGDAQFDGVGYTPEDQGLFFQRLLGRWPHWPTANIREKLGVIQGGEFIVNRTNHLLLTEVNGPGPDDTWDFKAGDVFDLVEQKKALVPVPSNGVLFSDLEIGQNQVSLSPVGIGNAEYPVSGRATIDNEVMSFTRSGDTLALTGRGLSGTSQETHEAGATFQLTERWVNARVDTVFADLLGYTTLPSSWIPTAEWQTEVDLWAPDMLLTRELTTPRPVLDELKTLAVMGLTFWINSEEQKISLAVSRPLLQTDPVTPLDQGALHSFTIEGRAKDRVTHVFIHSGLLDPSQDVEDANSYATHLLLVDPEAERAYKSPVYKTIYCPWIPANKQAVTKTIARYFLLRFRNPPSRYKVKLDAALEAAELMKVLRLTSDRFVSPVGGKVDKTVQVIQTWASVPGHEVELLCQVYEAGPERYGFITEDDAPDYDDATDAEKAGGGWISPDDLVFDSDGEPAYSII